MAKGSIGLPIVRRPGSYGAPVPSARGLRTVGLPIVRKPGSYGQSAYRLSVNERLTLQAQRQCQRSSGAASRGLTDSRLTECRVERSGASSRCTDYQCRAERSGASSRCTDYQGRAERSGASSRLSVSRLSVNERLTLQAGRQCQRSTGAVSKGLTDSRLTDCP